MFDPADPAFHPTERFHGVMSLAEAALHCGRAEDARTVIAALEADAAVTPSPTLHLHLAYARAVLADDDEAEDLFTAALGADLVRWPWLRARLELAYGSWLRRQRRVRRSAAAAAVRADHLRHDRRDQLGRSGARRAARGRRADRGPRSAGPARRRAYCRRRSCRSPGWPQKACPTARSANACSCRLAPSARTSTASSPSWA